VSDRKPPLVAGGQGRHPRDVIFGGRVVALCAAGILAVLLARAMGVL
jgi:hypothetical protein